MFSIRDIREIRGKNLRENRGILLSVIQMAPMEPPSFFLQ
jgi:hypothetical protein